MAGVDVVKSKKFSVVALRTGSQSMKELGDNSKAARKQPLPQHTDSDMEVESPGWFVIIGVGDPTGDESHNVDVCSYRLGRRRNA